MSTLVFAGVVYSARSFRQFSVSVDQHGAVLQHPGFEGKSHYRFASTTEAKPCTGQCLLYDIIMSSGDAQAYAIIYDSSTASANTSVVFGKLMFGATDGGRSVSQGSVAFPILFTYGIGIDLSSVGASEEVTLIYKDLD